MCPNLLSNLICIFQFEINVTNPTPVACEAQKKKNIIMLKHETKEIN